jgi:hypothetical protein
MATIHQFPTPIPVHTPHGEGKAMLLIDYELDTNSVWVVRLKGGKVLHYYSDDIRIYDNPMNGCGFDVEIPDNWIK